MCATCGCQDGATTTVTDPVTGEHSHVLADGTVVTHSHSHARSHTHAHDHTAHTHADEHTSHAHVHEHTSHAHAHEHTSHAHAHDAPIVARAPAEVHTLETRVLAKNDQLAERNRAFFQGRRLFVVNLMSSPGAGKTTLLEATLRAREGEVAVLEGDQETANDAARIRETGAPAVQINTGTGCHLEADMVWHGLERLDPPAGATLFIENVGNLVCPALFDLGEDVRVVLFSTTEGEDKPLKYPHMFRRADLVLFTKTDLLPHLDFDAARARDAVARIAPDAEVLDLSARTREGMDGWLAWLDERRASGRPPAADARVHPPQERQHGE